jgi:MFS family permease
MSVAENIHVKPAQRSEAYRRYVLFASTLVCMWGGLDSGLLGILMQPIKEDLQLSDTQLGLLSGIAFGLFYATLGVPIARWADRGNRTTIAALAIALWGAAVMACVFIGNFLQLLLLRMGTAIGDAGCRPPTYSLLGDYFPEPAARTKAMGIFWSSGALSGLVSFVVGGWLNELYGWRFTFFLMGLPGFIIAVLVKLTVVEPRALRSQENVSERQPYSIKSVIVFLWNQRSTRHLIIAFTVLQITNVGLIPWYAAFMMRSHSMGTAELGVWLGPIFGIGGTTGALLGGYVVGRWFAGDEKGQLRLGATMIGSVVPVFMVFLLVPHRWQALVALLVVMVALCFFIGPTFTLLQRLVVDEARATSLAVVMLFVNLIGMGIGPLMVGMLSDLLTPFVAHESLRYAMLIVSLLALWSACHFWRAGRTVKEDLHAMAERRERQRT